MSELIRKPENLVSLFHGGNEELPQPYESEIFLYSTFVSSPYIAGRREMAEHLQEDEELKLVRETNHICVGGDEYFRDIVKVLTTDGAKLGEIAFIDIEVCKNLLDAGKDIYAKVNTVDILADDALILLDIYMRD